jgi:hypothetical protein
MIEWLKDILGINRYSVKTTTLNDNCYETGTMTKRRAEEAAAVLQRKYWYADTVIIRKGGGQ